MNYGIYIDHQEILYELFFLLMINTIIAFIIPKLLKYLNGKN